MRSGVEARPTLERLSSRRDGDTMASSSGHTGSGCLHRLRLPPRSGSSFLSVSGDAPWLEQGPAELDQVAVHRRGSFTPRLGSLTTRLSERSRSVAKESKLAYNPRSWLETLDLLALHKKGAFLLAPCFLMTLWAVAITLVHAYWPETIGDLPVYVPTVLGSTMGVLLAFRLNTDELVVAGLDHPIRAAGDGDSPSLYIHVRRGCEARLNRSTYEQLAQIALARGDDWTVTSGGETYSLLPA